jgi:hypothetical protein
LPSEFLLLTFADVKELIHFIRSPTWITPTQQQSLATSKAATIVAEVEMDIDKFTPHQIEKFKSNPEYYLRFVKAVEEQVNSKFPIASIQVVLP